MKYWFLIIWIAGLAARPKCAAGTITGTVNAEGKIDAALDPNCASGKYDSHALRLAPRVDYTAMHEFVVYLEGPVSSPLLTNQTAQVITRKISQHKAMFVPHVLPIVKGTYVEWPNNDDIYHNVFSYSDIAPFDLGLYKAPEVKGFTFDIPGRVDVFCSIHASMNCIVLVLENPCFATTNERGEYTITNVPPGTYHLKAWHERLPSQRREITVPETGIIKEDFTLGIKGLPKI